MRGCKRLDAPAEHLGRLGDVLDTGDRNAALLLEVRGGASRRDRPPTRARSAPPRTRRCRACRGRRSGAWHRSLTTSGSRRCSTAWRRSRSVSRGSTGNASCLNTGPVSTPSSTRCTVTPVSRTPAASASSTGVEPGNSGRSEGWTFSIRPGKRSRNGLREQVHIRRRARPVRRRAPPATWPSSGRAPRDLRGSPGRTSRPAARLRGRGSGRRRPSDSLRRRGSEPASSSAWRLVPVPLTRTPITRVLRSRSRRRAPR